LIGQGQLQPAALALNEAQRRSPRDARVPLLGMRMAAAAGNAQGAIQAARRALALAPNWPVAMLELGALLARGNQVEQAARDEAMRLAGSAVALEPDDPIVLYNAAAIAYASHQKEQALAWQERAHTQRPDDVQLRFTLARGLLEFRRHADARPHFEWLAQRFPDSPSAALGLMDCALAAGDGAAARGYADRALAAAPDDPNVQYWHEVAHDRTPPTQSAASIANIFDNYAPGFDMHLVRGLKYKVPERVAQMLLALHPDRQFNLLDLGCGTGLLGVYLGPIQGHIIGVDLSLEMVKQAARHQVYSRFHNVNILDALRETPADHYEVITCLDALIYVGDLAPVIPGALRILKPGGHFIFSCEAAQEGEPDLALRHPSNRYAHRDSAVERLCREAGFADIQIEQLPVLRMENLAPLPGFLVTARKLAA
jgi:predicted TPR repeat methyltransferase